ENISIKAGSSDNTSIKRPSAVKGKSVASASAWSADIEKSNDLQFKYSILMDEPVESVTDKRLIGFLDEWYGIPYRYGGGTKLGKTIRWGKKAQVVPANLFLTESTT